MREFFSMQGRYNRARCFRSVLFIYVLILVVALFVQVVMSLSGAGAAGAEAFVSYIRLVGISGSVLAAFPVVKRLHDLSRPGTHYWLLLIPLYGQYLGLVLLFQTGTRGPNEFGPDPILVQQQAKLATEQSEWSQYVRPRLGRLGRQGISIDWNPAKAEEDYHALQESLKVTLAKGDRHEALALLRSFVKRHPMSYERDVWRQIIALEKDTSKANKA